MSNVANADAQLLAAWSEGDRTAGARFIQRFFDPVTRFFTTKAGPHADDLTQQTFLRCSEAASRWRRQSSAKAFLFGIARNVLYEHIRRQSAHRGRVIDFTTSALVDLLPGVETQVSKDADRRLVIAAMQAIPLELQMVLELYYWEEMSVGQLAEMLKVPSGTVKSRLHRARRLLREALETVAATPQERLSASQLIEGWVDA